MASKGLQGLTAITCGELLGHEKDGCDQSLRRLAIVGIGLKAPQLGGNKILAYKSIVLRQLPDPDIFTCTASGFIRAT